MRPPALLEAPGFRHRRLGTVGCILMLASVTGLIFGAILRSFSDQHRALATRICGVILMIGGGVVIFLVNRPAPARAPSQQPSFTISVKQAPSPTEPTVPPTPAPTPLPPLDSVRPLVEQARAEWQKGNYQGSLSNAESARAILVGHLGPSHPEVTRIDAMITAAKQQLQNPQQP